LSKKAYNGKNVTAHATLADKINQRKPGLGPKSGESVQYLFVDFGLDAKDKRNVNMFKKRNYVKCGEGFVLN
jgi:hypothetical protein